MRGVLRCKGHMLQEAEAKTPVAQILPLAASGLRPQVSELQLPSGEGPCPARLTEQSGKERSPPKKQREHKDRSGAEKALRHSACRSYSRHCRKVGAGCWSQRLDHRVMPSSAP